ncbi:MAG: peptidoglycan-binding domain-containing protein [Candidatus Gracilibacteria bacterium]
MIVNQFVQEGISGDYELELLNAVGNSEAENGLPEGNVDLANINIDGKLKKSEIAEVKKMVNYTKEKTDILLHLQDKFMDFIDSEYRHANETFLLGKNKNIKDLQVALNLKLGIEIQEDGIFSKETFLTIIRFQKENNLVVDGLVGNNTYKVLFLEE